MTRHDAQGLERVESQQGQASTGDFARKWLVEPRGFEPLTC